MTEDVRTIQLLRAGGTGVRKGIISEMIPLRDTFTVPGASLVPHADYATLAHAIHARSLGAVLDFAELHPG